MLKGERMAKRSSFGIGSVVRKRLSDITNSIPQPKSPFPDKKLSPTDSSEKEHIDHLVKENIALAKLIADKNKIIEFTGIELQKMRVSLQKMQMQNWNLAQSNSHMLAELNLGKDKLKALRHEIVCKDAVIKAKDLELEGKAQVNNSQKNCSQEVDEVAGEHKADDNTKLCKGPKRRPTRSQSMGPSTTTSQQVAEKEASESKRRCLRRQSARFISQPHEPTDNLFEIEVAKFLVPPRSSVKKGENDENCEPIFEARESRRTSLGRPVRRAAEKVQSYKEVPRNIKMRRSE
ncbi:SHUGOSHIN 2-like [Rhododendron vialii]|uniref:SHUGOSHIN 2-like n=1 Tax=Rhododendron vialii TaxID=182163 RepID=UPI00265FFEB8|nr:SHUGOSHIN 2-like [Rhododendron vialii]XP_058223834.1 SHUGOSHIN 2-like [Rhododendron vialii]